MSNDGGSGRGMMMVSNSPHYNIVESQAEDATSYYLLDDEATATTTATAAAAATVELVDEREEKKVSKRLEKSCSHGGNENISSTQTTQDDL